MGNVGQKHSTASGPNLGLFKSRIPEALKGKIPISSGDTFYQLLKTQSGKANLCADENPRQLDHSLLTPATAL